MIIFLQRDLFGSRNFSIVIIIIDYLLIVNVQDTAIVRTGLESIDPIFGNIYQSRKDITEMIRQFSVQDRRLRYCSGLDYLRFLQIGYPLELSFVIGISYPMLRRLYG